MGRCRFFSPLSILNGSGSRVANGLVMKNEREKGSKHSSEQWYAGRRAGKGARERQDADGWTNRHAWLLSMPMPCCAEVQIVVRGSLF